MKTFLCLSSRLKIFSFKKVVAAEAKFCSRFLSTLLAGTGMNGRQGWRSKQLPIRRVYQEYSIRAKEKQRFTSSSLFSCNSKEDWRWSRSIHDRSNRRGERFLLLLTVVPPKKEVDEVEGEEEGGGGEGRLWSLLKYLDSRLQRNLRREREFGIWPDCLFPPGLEWESSLDCDEKRRERSQSRTRAPSSPFSCHHLWFLSCLSFLRMHLRRQNNLSSQSWCPGWTGIRQECSVSWTWILFSLLPPLLLPLIFLLLLRVSPEKLKDMNDLLFLPLHDVCPQSFCLFISKVISSGGSLHFLSSFIRSISIKNFRDLSKTLLLFPCFMLNFMFHTKWFFHAFFAVSSLKKEAWFSEKTENLWREDASCIMMITLVTKLALSCQTPQILSYFFFFSRASHPFDLLSWLHSFSSWEKVYSEGMLLSLPDSLSRDLFIMCGFLTSSKNFSGDEKKRALVSRFFFSLTDISTSCFSHTVDKFEHEVSRFFLFTTEKKDITHTHVIITWLQKFLHW